MRSGIMLCYPFEEKRLLKWQGPYLLQRKLDGERCRAILAPGKITLLSSEGNEFKHLPHINQALSRLDIVGLELDGELYNHGLKFQDIHSICSRKINPHPEYGMIEYHIFDLVNDRPQVDRLLFLRQMQEIIIRKGLEEELKIVQTYDVNSLDDIMKYFEVFIQENYEGFVIRDKNAFYKRTRSTQLMKYKPHQEDIYPIIGWQEEISINGIPKGTMGALICQGDSQDSFNIGSGPLLTQDGRKALWDIREGLKGMYLRVKYQNLTTGKGIPRFPVALQIINPDGLIQ